MNISYSDMKKNYKKCLRLANRYGKVLIEKNSQINAVLLSISEYERLSVPFEQLESRQKSDFTNFIASLPPEGNRKVYTLCQLKNDLNIDRESTSA